MALGNSASRHVVRALFVVLLAGFSLSGCDTLNSLTGKSSRSRSRNISSVPSTRSIAMPGRNHQGDWVGAAKQFDEVERQHPYSVWARRAMLMSAYCYYHANHYDDAINTADQYIALHPGSKEVAYAFYLKAVSLYEQIVDVGRDQSNTEGALTALQDVVQRFPNSSMPVTRRSRSI